MAYSVTLVVDDTDDWNEVLAYMGHLQNCAECQSDPAIVSASVDQAAQTISAELATGSMGWGIPNHES